MIEVTDESFASFVKAEHVTFLIFSAPWCGPCRTLKASVAEKLEKRDYAANAGGDAVVSKVEFGVMDTDKCHVVPSMLRVSSIPTAMIYRGGMRRDVLVGVQPETTYLEAIQAALDSPRTPESPRPQ